MLSFDSFIQHVSDRIQQPLPGPEAQYAMAPQMRLPKDDYLKKDNSPRESAVMILLYPHQDDTHLVLIERPTYEGAHSGQISFPGGRVEPEDDSLATTALRETEEEVGVYRDTITVVGEMTDLYIPASRFLVYPFIGYVEEKPAFVPEPKEVAQILEVPVRYLSQPHVRKETQMRLFNNMRVTTPYFDVQGRVVWGATAMMLSEFLHLTNA